MTLRSHHFSTCGVVRLTGVIGVMAFGTFGGVSLAGQAGVDSVEAHVKAAEAAAGQEYNGMFHQLCDAPSPPGARQGPPAAGRGQGRAGAGAGAGADAGAGPGAGAGAGRGPGGGRGRKFRDIVAKTGADILLSNHTAFDGSKTKLPAVQSRKPGAPNPYVIGNDSVKRFLTMADECAKAGLLRTTQ